VDYLTLAFSCDASWDQLRQLGSEIVTALRGTAEPWIQQSRQDLPDKNYPHQAFKATWSLPGATLDEHCRCGSGNPRDGYGYQLRWQLQVHHDGTSSVFAVKCASYQASPQQVTMRLRPPSDRVATLARAVLRRVLGVEYDDVADPVWAADNVETLAAIEPEAASRWLAEALATPSRQHASANWARLLALHERFHGATDASRLQRLTQAPQDMAGWEAALAQPPPGWTTSRIQAVIDRLRPVPRDSLRLPFDPPPLAEWRRLQDSAAATTESRIHVVWALIYTLWPSLSGSATAWIDQVVTGPAVASTQVRALWPAGPCLEVVGKALPVAVVERRVHTYSSDWPDLPQVEKMDCRPCAKKCQFWLWGPQAEDVAMLFTRTDQGISDDPDRQGELDLGLVLHLSGSPAFVARVEAALKTVSPFPWLPVSGSQMRSPTAPETSALPSANLPPRERVPGDVP